MSESESSQVFMFDDNDPEMHHAYESARATFRYFWREVAWERRRIIPGLDLACVKAPFSDGQRKHADGAPRSEHMWLSDIDFDGELVSGALINSPNWVRSVIKGDSIREPLNKICDWIYAIRGVVFGGYTVNLMRSRMESQERQEHDAAWGLNFGDPSKVRVIPELGMGGGLLRSWFGGQSAHTQEHPMSVNMAASLMVAAAEKRLSQPNRETGLVDTTWISRCRSQIDLCRYLCAGPDSHRQPGLPRRFFASSATHRRWIASSSEVSAKDSM